LTNALFPCHADKLDSVRTHKGQCIHFYVHVHPGNPTRTGLRAIRVGHTPTGILVKGRRATPYAGENHRETWRRIRVLCVCT